MPQDARRLAGTDEAGGRSRRSTTPTCSTRCCARRGLQSVAAAPLSIGQGASGALQVGSLHAREFTPRGGVAAQRSWPTGRRSPCATRASTSTSAASSRRSSGACSPLAAARARVHDGRALPACRDRLARRRRLVRRDRARGGPGRDRDRRRLGARDPGRGADGPAAQRAARVRLRGLSAVGRGRAARQPRAPARERLVRDARLRRHRAGRPQDDDRERRPSRPARRHAGRRGDASWRTCARSPLGTSRPHGRLRGGDLSSCPPARCSSSTPTGSSSGAARRCSTRSSTCARSSAAGPAEPEALCEHVRAALLGDTAAARRRRVHGGPDDPADRASACT